MHQNHEEIGPYTAHEQTRYALKSELELLRRAPLIKSGEVRVRRPKSIFSLSSAKLRWIELRADVLLICAGEHQRGGVVHVEALEGASVVRKDATRLIIGPLRKSCEGRKVELTFSCSAELEEWRIVLDSIVSQRSYDLFDFEVVSPIGKGGAGKVFLVRQKDSGKLYAMKVIQKFSILDLESSIRHAVDERHVLELIQGLPFLLQLEHAFQTKDNLYLVSEFCSNGDLSRYLQHNAGNKLSEEVSRMIVAEVMIALESLHERGIVYRDLKPENIFIDTDGHVKLADFGLSKILQDGKSGRTNSFCGTREYISPELALGCNYGQKIDVWSLGILLYRLVCGYTPFYSRNQTRFELFQSIQDDPVIIPSQVSQPLGALISRLLEKNEEKRITLEEVKSHAFFETIDWNKLSNKEYVWYLGSDSTESASILRDGDHEIAVDLERTFKVSEMKEDSLFSRSSSRQHLRGLLPSVLNRDQSRQSLIAGYSFSSLSLSGNFALTSIDNQLLY